MYYTCVGGGLTTKLLPGRDPPGRPQKNSHSQHGVGGGPQRRADPVTEARQCLKVGTQAKSQLGLSMEFIDSYCPSDVWRAPLSTIFKIGSIQDPCFNEVAILGTSNVTFLLLGAVRLNSLCSTRPDVPTTGTCGKKFIAGISSLLALIPLFQLNALISRDGSGIAPLHAGCLALMSVTYLFVTYLQRLESRRPVMFSGWSLRVGYILALVAQSLKLNSVLDHGYSLSYFFVLYYVQAGLVALNGLTALLYWPSTPIDPNLDGELRDFAGDYIVLEDGRAVSPENSASPFSKLFFSWMSPMMSLGNVRPLTQDDMYDPADCDQAVLLDSTFQKFWALEIQKRKPSLVTALNSSFGRDFWIGGSLKLFNDASQFVGPLFLSALVKFSGDPSVPMWHGYAYAFSIFAGSMIGAFAEAQYFQFVMRAGTQVRSCLVSAIFRKALTLASKEREEYDTGKINNLMTSDTEALWNSAQNFHIIW